MRHESSKKLTPKQKRFVEEYIISLNASDAARKAGYSEKSSGWIGQQLLVKTHVLEAIQSALQKRSAKTQVTAEMVITELAKIAFADVRKLFDDQGLLKSTTDLDDFTAGAVGSIEAADGTELKLPLKKIRMCDKKGALELLGKHLGMFSDRIALSGPDNGPIKAEVSLAIPEPVQAIITAVINRGTKPADG